MVLKPNPDNNSKEKIKSILNLLKEGESIKYESHKSITLFLGNTGSGKSTLAQFVAGDNNKLISEEVGAETGEYIIIDNNNRISGNSTITSKTVFPEMVKDSHTNNVYYDCPGFSDTRSSAHDITVTYFIKKIIESSESIKLVFVVSYPSVRKGVDRQDFILLVKHATDMIKNIEKFENSIALIVTKVDNETIRNRKSFVLVPDNAIIKKIGAYLMLVRQELVNKSIDENPLTDHVFNEKAIKFIDILLSKNEGEYSRIGIFRRPDEAGLISQVSLLQEGKMRISELLTNNINFVNHVENDFGYTISSESKNYIHELSNEITAAVNLNVGNIGSFIKKYYTTLEKNKFDLEYLYKQLAIGDDLLFDMKDASKFVRARDIITPLIKISDELNIKSGKFLYEISVYDKYLEFIKKVNDDSTANQVIWLHGLTSVIDYVGSSKKWYRFMIDIFNRLSEYDVQTNTSKFNINNIKLKISSAKHKIGENKEVRAEDIDLTQLIEQFGDNNKLYLDYDEIKNSLINDSKLNALKQLLDDTLNFKIKTYYPSDNKLTVEGHFIKISDIIDKANSENVEVIEILALYKIFIDASIDKTGRGANILIISPTWQIIEKQTFSLDGKDGEDNALTKGFIFTFTGENGSAGESGTPGGSAGHFFGIGKTFIDGENLIVHANGGRGGAGQKGGDGADGKVGHSYPRPNTKYNLNYNYGHNNYQILKKTTNWHHCFFVFGRIDEESTSLILPGRDGGTGGNGGSGGIGGQGGYNGIVKLFEMGKNSNIIIKNSEGQRGNPGMGGNPGSGGDGGRDLQIDYYETEDCLSDVLSFRYNSIEYTKRRNVGSPGESGVKGASHKNEKQPIMIPFSNPSQTINKYKMYLKENLDGSANVELLRTFQKQLENDENITGYYDAASLVLEFEQLENVSNKIRDKEALLTFYDSLLRRIDAYSKNPKLSDRTDEYKKLISYLYIAVLSKMCNMDSKINSNLNLDLHNYLETLIKNVNEIKENNDIKLSVDDYIDIQNKLNARISDIRSFFDTQIPSFIKNNSDDIDKQTELLLAEMATVDTITSTDEVSIIEDEIQENNVKNKELEFLKTEEKLNDATVSKIILNYLDLSQQYLVILTKLTSALNVAQTMTANNSILLDEFPQEKVNEISASFSSVQDSLKIMESRFENIKTFFTKQLNDINQYLSDFLKEHPTSTLDEINRKILFTIEKVATITDETNIDFIKNDLLEIITSMKKSIKLNSSLDDSGVEETILLDVIRDVLNVEYSSSTIYENNKDEHLKINKLARSFKGETLNKIKGYKKHLNQIINIQGIEEKVKVIMENVELKKTADINIQDWNIKKMLKYIKRQMQEVSEEFDKDEDLRNMMEKIKLSITLLIDIYDGVYSINNQAKMATYISDITSVKSTELNIKNKELIKIIDKLNNVIKTNLITGKYDKAVDVVRKHIFPFAKSYNDDFSLPINNNNNIAEYADRITSEIRNFENKNLKSTDLLGVYERYLHNGIEFNSQHLQTSPFFIWRYENIKKSLSKLLEGEEITLVADLFKGVQKNVVKFNEIGIRFKLLDDNLQKQFDGVLNNFGVTLVHQGDSHYKCDDRIFIMVSDKKNIYYTFNTKTNGEPIDKNIVYDKLKNSHLVLSPYATWSIKLKNVTDTFDVLKDYKEKEIDIELKGNGQYIDKEVDLCSDELENYYEQDDSLSVLENQIYKEDLLEGSFKDVNIRNRRNVALENDFNFGRNLQLLEGTEVKNSTDFNVPNIQSNLLLLDMMVKMKMKNKSRSKKNSFKLNKDFDHRYAHSLAYRAHIPKK